MKKLLIILSTVFLVTISASIISAQELEKPKLFVREGCSHCAKVKAFLEKYELTDQVEILDAAESEDIDQVLTGWYDNFDIPQQERGVPFLVLDQTDYMIGDTPIIEYFAEENGIEIEEEDYETSTSDTVFLAIGAFIMLVVFGYGIYSAFVTKKTE